MQLHKRHCARILVEINTQSLTLFGQKNLATSIRIVQSFHSYAFEQLNAQEVYSIIRDTNAASQKVAERNGMVRCGENYFSMFILPLLSF
jgi:predicted dinucleotide-binding enzyme